MLINADKPHMWKADTQASVDQFNQWFLRFAPSAYKSTRGTTIEKVEQALQLTADLTAIDPATIAASPEVLQVLRMATCPPIARDRLVGLSGTTKSFVESMEEGRIPPRLTAAKLSEHLQKVCAILAALMDTEIFPWLEAKRPPTSEERYRSSTIVADRLCGAIADPIVRNAQEKRQLDLLEQVLREKGYQSKLHPMTLPLEEMEPGTFHFRMNVLTKSPKGDAKDIRIPIDAVIQPVSTLLPNLPILIEAKSAGDFTNVNKRRKEEANKMQNLRSTYGDGIPFILLLCGYFDAAYLGYEAAEGIDWIWEHRIKDIDLLGI